jgi:acetoin utilization deacetylase AcuC-like enzyme
MRAFYSDQFVLPLSPGHRFPMEKYGLLRERLGKDMPASAIDFQVPHAATDGELTRVHDPAYVRKVAEGALTKSEVRRMGFPWSPELVERSRRSVGGTIGAARAALAEGIAVNLSGGTHHAFPTWGEGFCVFNDVAVATRCAQEEEGIERIVILDLDVHQGNGTAHIFRDTRDVFTLSVHGANNYPFRKVAGDLDIELGDDTDDETFLAAAESGVVRALDSGPFDLAFYLAGADPLSEDRLGRLSVSRETLLKREQMVFSACEASDLPVALVMAGGYADPIEATVEVHVGAVRTAVEFASH